MDLTKRYNAFKAYLARVVELHAVESMKFQCRGSIGIGILESVHDLPTLLRLLEEMDEINASDLFYLETVFRNLKRDDLLKITRAYNDTRENGTFIIPDTQEIFSSDRPPAKKGQLESDSTKEDVMEEEMMVEKSRVESNNEARPFTTGRSVATPTAIVNSQLSGDFARGIELVVNNLSRGWQNAARHLGVPESIIDNAGSNWPRNIRNQIKEAFEYWKR